MTATIAEFTLPAELEAHAPPEARGLPRDGVRMLVSRAADATVAHHHFTDLPGLLLPGDLLVVNNSRTLPAAVPAGPDLTDPLLDRPAGWQLAGGAADPGREIQPPPRRRAAAEGHRAARRRRADPDRPRDRAAVEREAVGGGRAVPAAARRADPLLLRRAAVAA